MIQQIEFLTKFDLLLQQQVGALVVSAAQSLQNADPTLLLQAKASERHEHIQLSGRYVQRRGAVCGYNLSGGWERDERFTEGLREATSDQAMWEAPAREQAASTPRSGEALCMAVSSQIVHEQSHAPTGRECIAHVFIGDHVARENEVEACKKVPGHRSHSPGGMQ